MTFVCQRKQKFFADSSLPSVRAQCKPGNIWAPPQDWGLCVESKFSTFCQENSNYDFSFSFFIFKSTYWLPIYQPCSVTVSVSSDINFYRHPKVKLFSNNVFQQLIAHCRRTLQQKAAAPSSGIPEFISEKFVRERPAMRFYPAKVVPQIQS